MTVIFLSEVLKLPYMSHTTTRDAERTTGTLPVDSLCQTQSLEEGTVLFTLSATDTPSSTLYLCSTLLQRRTVETMDG